MFLLPRAWRQMFPFPHWDLGRRKEAADSLSQLHRPNVPDCLFASSRKLFNYFSSAANVVRKNARPKSKLRGKISAAVAADLLTLPSPPRRSAMMMGGAALRVGVAYQRRGKAAKCS